MHALPVYKIENFEFYNASFYARRLKEHIRLHGFIQHPHKHNFYLSVLFTKGTGVHEIDFAQYPVAKGSAFFLLPGQVHRWTLTDDADGYIFFHTKEFYEVTCINKRINDFSVFSLAQQQPYIQLGDADFQQAEGIFSRILKEYAAPDSGHKFNTLGALCNLLYLDMDAQCHADALPTVGTALYRHKINELFGLIEENYTTLKYPKEYAEQLNISTKHLNRICKETLGKTTGELIAERIILEAKRILTYSNKPIKQIAEQLGFDDVAYFIRFFRKQTAQTPRYFQAGYSIKNNK